MIHPLNSDPSFAATASVEHWEAAITQLLDELLQTQHAMLQLLNEKRRAMVKRDLLAIRDLQPEEERLCSQLQRCQERREELLAHARAAQLPGDDLRVLSRHVTPQAGNVNDKLSEATNRSILLKHQSLTNWIIAQRNLLHISQMLEIITSGGSAMPTYGKNSGNRGGGFVLDQEA